MLRPQVIRPLREPVKAQAGICGAERQSLPRRRGDQAVRGHAAAVCSIAAAPSCSRTSKTFRARIDDPDSTSTRLRAGAEGRGPGLSGLARGRQHAAAAQDAEARHHRHGAHLRRAHERHRLRHGGAARRTRSRRRRAARPGRTATRSSSTSQPPLDLLVAPELARGRSEMATHARSRIIRIAAG